MISVLPFLQMRSQFDSPVFAALLAGLALGCGNRPAQTLSSVSIPEPAGSLRRLTGPAEGDPDLTLSSVEFARLSDSRVVARGTAEQLDYRRSGGRMVAARATVSLEAQPGTALAALGDLHVVAARVSGEITARRGTAEGGVRLDAERGDSATTDRVFYDGPTGTVRSADPVAARGPGYSVHSKGLLARTDGSEVRLTGGVKGSLSESPR